MSEAKWIWLTNDKPGKWHPHGCVEGDPKPSDVLSIDELKAIGLVGIYYEKKPNAAPQAPDGEGAEAHGPSRQEQSDQRP